MSIMRMPSPTQGVPSPYTAHNHPYPTRFHGTLYTRPVAVQPFVHAPASYFQNRVLHRQGMQGLGYPLYVGGREVKEPVVMYHGPGPVSGFGDLDIQVGNGVFRPSGEGGGIFMNSISGYGALGTTVDQAKLLVAAASAALATAIGSGNQDRIAAATAELNRSTALLNEAQATAGQAAANKAATDAQKKSGGGTSFIAPQPVGPIAPLPGNYTSGGMSPGAKAALIGGGAALLLAVGYFMMKKG